MVGMRLSWAYVSDLRLTRSIQIPLTFMRAVSRCLDWSGLDWITAAERDALPCHRGGGHSLQVLGLVGVAL